MRESLHLRANPVDNAQFALRIRYIVKRDLHICKRDLHQRAIRARVCICVPTQLIMPNLPCAYVIMSKETYMYGKETLKRDLRARQTLNETYSVCKPNEWSMVATHCNTLQHTATDCDRLRHTTTHCDTLRHTVTHCDTLAHCNTLQHTVPHSNTLQHTATTYATHAQGSMPTLPCACVVMSKKTHTCAKETYIYAKETYTYARETHSVCICKPTQLSMPPLPCACVVMSKEIYTFAKETYTYAKETCKDNRQKRRRMSASGRTPK